MLHAHVYKVTLAKSLLAYIEQQNLLHTVCVYDVYDD